MRQLQRSIATAFDGCSGELARVGPLYTSVIAVLFAAGSKSCHLLTLYSILLTYLVGIFTVC